MMPPGFTFDAIKEEPSDDNQNPAVYIREMEMMDDDNNNNQQEEHPQLAVDPSCEDSDMSKKLLAQELPSSSSTLLTHNSTTTQYAAFRGLYVVQSATEERHVRYAMEISCTELHLHMRCTQRYNSFYLLRKRLLQSLKKCQVDGARPTVTESPILEMPAWCSPPCCAGCAEMRATLKRVPFPKRSLFFTTAEDIDARTPLLEVFLDACFVMLVDWKGCLKGRKFVSVVLGKFLSFNLLNHVFQQLRLTMLEAEPATANKTTEEEEGEQDNQQSDNHSEQSALAGDVAKTETAAVVVAVAAAHAAVTDNQVSVAAV